MSVPQRLQTRKKRATKGTRSPFKAPVTTALWGGEARREVEQKLLPLGEGLQVKPLTVGELTFLF